MCSDSVADMLTRIRNAQLSKLLFVSVAKSRFNALILDVLQTEGYINGYVEESCGRLLLVELKYSKDGFSAISELHRVSKPGRRMYSSISDLRPYYNSMGIYIISTSKGVMSNRLAGKLKVGGEVICKVF